MKGPRIQITLKMPPVPGQDWLSGEHRRCLMDDLDQMMDEALEQPFLLDLGNEHIEAKILLRPSEWMERRYTMDGWSVVMQLFVSVRKLAPVLTQAIEAAHQVLKAYHERPPQPRWWHRWFTPAQVVVEPMSAEQMAREGQRLADQWQDTLLPLVSERTQMTMYGRIRAGTLYPTTRAAGYSTPLDAATPGAADAPSAGEAIPAMEPSTPKA